METIIKPITEYLEKFNGIFPIIIIEYDCERMLYERSCNALIVAKFKDLTELKNNILPPDVEDSFLGDCYDRYDDDDDGYNSFRDRNLHKDPFEVLKEIEKIEYGCSKFKEFYGPGAEQMLNFICNY